MAKPGIRARPRTRSSNYKPRAGAVVCLGRMPVTSEACRDIESRVKTAASLFKNTNAKALILSGGRTFGSAQSEAAYMEKIAVALGVPKSKILLEEQSGSTYENAICTMELSEKKHLHSLAIVTSNYHIFRTGLIFRRLLPKFTLEFFASPYPISFSLIARILREIPHIIRITIFGLYE